MSADCPACGPPATDIRKPSRARARLPWLGVLPTILYVLAPKCPMCLVAYLSAFGMASLALSILPTLAVASGVSALGFVLWRAKAYATNSRANLTTSEAQPGTVSKLS
jgi:hypothetical protein